MRTVLVAAALLASAVTVARADAPGNTPPQYGDGEQPRAALPAPMLGYRPMMMPEVPPPVHEKSPQLAAAISLGATTLGYAMMFKGDGNPGSIELGAVIAFVGPSTGQWYAGKVGGLGMGARAVALVTMIYGIAHMSVADCFDCNASAQSESEADRGKTYLIAGAALWVGSTIYDVWAAYHETELYNERQHAAANRMFAPTMIQGSNNTIVPGMAFSAKF